MKVAIGYNLKKKKKGGGLKFAHDFKKYFNVNGYEVLDKLSKNVDIAMMTDPRPKIGSFGPEDIKHWKKYGNKFAIHRINECDARKGTNFIDDIILKGNKHFDHTIFISEWLKKYFIKKGFDINRSHEVIYNGANDLFFHGKSWNGKSKLKLVTHHWSDNWMKGFDLYQYIDQLIGKGLDIEFTYIGNVNKKAKFKYTKIIDVLDNENLAKELKNNNIYVTGSRYEPCGMHHIEGARCGLPVIYHKDGGGICETCKNYGIQMDKTIDFIKCLNKIKSDYKIYRKNVLDCNLTSELSLNKYLRFIKNCNEHNMHIP